MASIPPAPPPPPPPVQFTPKTLARSERPPANSNSIGGVRATDNTPNRPGLAQIHPEAIQRAAANLRKTQHNQSILPSESEQLLGRPIELPSGGYRQNFEKHDPMEFNQTRTEIHASNPMPNACLPINNSVGNSSSITTRNHLPAPALASSSKWTTSYGQPLFFSTKSNSPSNLNNISNNNNKNYSSTYSSSSSTSTYPQQPQGIQTSSSYSSSTSTYQQPQQPQGIQSSSYSYSMSTSSKDSVNPPDYPPPPPPPAAEAGNFYPNKESTNFYSSSTTNNSHPQNPSISPYISNPQSYIHEFATKTPASPEASPPPPSITQDNRPKQQPQQQQPVSYAEQLRNSTLTDRQKFANQFQRSNLPERLPPQAVAHIYQETTAGKERELSHRRQQPEYPPMQASKVDEVNELIKTMEWKMRTGSTNDICSKCQKEILGDTPGVTALGKPYHVTCFSCDVCTKQLAGCSFYSVDGKNLCQVDYMNSLDKCDKCATPITQKILRAMGKAFHPECFACPSCTKTLDGIPFTVDPQGTPYCLDCYHERFSPRCAVCLKAIVPQAGETEVARIVAMDRSYHLQCYKCEDCGLQLNSKIEGQGCYPLENHLFCKNCNLTRIRNKH